jgi:hypothetical protein
VKIVVRVVVDVPDDRVKAVFKAACERGFDHDGSKARKRVIKRCLEEAVKSQVRQLLGMEERSP